MNERITQQDVENFKREVLEESLLVAPAEAAKILSVSERTVHSLVKEGELHAYARNRRARGLRILASELRDYVSSIKIDKDDWRE